MRKYLRLKFNPAEEAQRAYDKAVAMCIDLRQLQADKLERLARIEEVAGWYKAILRSTLAKETTMIYLLTFVLLLWL